MRKAIGPLGVWTIAIPVFGVVFGVVFAIFFFAVFFFAVSPEAFAEEKVETVRPRPNADARSLTPDDFAPLKNPSMKWAQGTFAKDPSVVRFNGKYLLYYSFFLPKNDEGKSVLTVGVAESEDGADWRFVKNILPMETCDRNGLGAPCARVIDNKVWLFYQTYGNGPKDAICCAWSENGFDFTPHPKNPVFRPQGDWTNGRAIDADVVPFQGKWFLYAATRDPGGKIQKLVVAVAEPKKSTEPKNAANEKKTPPIPDGKFGPEDWRQAADFSILEPKLAWETRCVEAPTAVEQAGRLYLFYAGGYNNDPQQIGVAVSSDGIHWTRLWDIPLIPNGPAGQWNASESGHPGVFVDDDGQTWLYFQGNASKGKDWFLSRVRIDWDRTDPDFPIPTVAEK